MKRTEHQPQPLCGQESTYRQTHKCRRSLNAQSAVHGVQLGAEDNEGEGRMIAEQQSTAAQLSRVLRESAKSRRASRRSTS